MRPYAKTRNTKTDRERQMQHKGEHEKKEDYVKNSGSVQIP